MDLTPKFTTVLIFVYFFYKCQSIYIPGKGVHKPSMRREILVRPPLHKAFDNFGENVTTDYDTLEEFQDENPLVNVGLEKPEYRPVVFADEAERDGNADENMEVKTTQVPFIDTVTGERWNPNTYREVVTGTRVIVQCPTGATGQFPYPPNCLYFLNCWKGRGFVQPCALGTLFNPETLECDFPGKVKCLPYREQTEEDVRAIRAPGHDAGRTPKQNQRPTPTPSRPATRPSNQQIICAMDGGTGLAPHPSDCSKFINCWNYQPLVQSCDSGTMFNPSSLRCDYPHNFNCFSENGHDTDGTPTEHQQSTPSPSQLSPRPHQEITCAMEGGTGLAPHPSDCSKFINCWKYAPFVQSCGPGTVFNPSILQCDYPYNVNCYSEKGHGTGRTPKQQQHTPSSNQSAPRSHEQLTCAMEGGTGVVPHPSDCSKFINCWNNVPYVQSCDSGRVFNPSSLQCDYPHNVHCFSEDRVSRTDNELSSVPPETQKISSTSTETPILVSTVVANPTTESTTTLFTIVDSDAASTLDNLPVEQVDASGQVLRLRGGSGPWEGYVEIRGSSPGWGLICDDSRSWTIKEANVVCRQLGYERGAEFAWQGRPIRPTEDTLKVSVDTITCSGDEATVASCHLSYGHQRCIIARDAVGVRCYMNSASQCNSKDANFGGKCYTLVEEGWDGAFTHGEAIQHCKSMGGHLLDINSQAESDFISEWLIQLHPEITSIITSGVGVNVGGSALWIWEGSKKPFRFEKWWPGWTKEYAAAPETGAKPVCVEAKRVFPCDMSYYSSQEQGDVQVCGANYFYWDTEECSKTHSHPYICEKPHYDIGCVNGIGQDYAGTANVTENGMPCINWDLDEVRPYVWPKISDQESLAELSGHSYCRNIGGTESHPWCFIGPHGKTELCDIPLCSSFEILRRLSEESYKCGYNQFQCELNECIDSSYVCDGQKDCINGRDELQCSSNLNKFTHHAGSRLVNHDIEKWIRANPNTCARQCLEVKHFTCLSFSYNSENGSCVLSNSNIGLSGDLQVYSNWNYYERKSGSINCDKMFVCGNGKCVNASVACDGKNDCGDRSDEQTCSIEYLDYSIRLAGGNTSYEGRVEVKVFGRWGMVCDDKFGLRDAEVVCRELGFMLGAADVKSNSFFGPHDSNPLFLVDDLECLGNETSIRECDFNGWGVHDCAADEVVGVTCKVPGKECPDNAWQCKHSKECIPIVYLCDEDIDDCEDGSDESAECQSAVQLRLIGGSSNMEGRVEVQYMGTWGTVCDDDFTSKSASVVCHSLGFGGPAEVRKDAAFGAGDGPIWLDQVHCGGNESRIEDCFHSNWGQHNCKHDEDVGVVCTPGKVSREPDVTVLVPASVNDTENDLYHTTYTLPANCGSRGLPVPSEGIPDPRVLKGKEVVKGMYPWQASVRVRSTSKSMHWCGAVIVSPLHILTAGHCLNDYNKEAYYVRVGDHDTEVDDGSEQEANIEEIYIHEEFNKGVRLNNDIAVVKLKGRGIYLSTNVQPICLPPPNIPYTPGLNCTISGWGSSKAGGSGYARRLQATWLPIVPHDTCKASFVYGAKAISEGMFCAGYLEGGMDACQGDSGGPMVCLRDGVFTLYGIISWGHGCGRPNKPGVYSNIAYYRNWIDRKLQESMNSR